MNVKTENFSISLNIELNDSKIRVIDESELQYVTGGAVVVMGASLFGSTYTQTQIVGQSFSPALSWIPTQSS